MTLEQFDFPHLLRCAAVSDEGYNCVRFPRHPGDHVWGRCEMVDAEGHRCGLPPRHPNDHWFPWYDRPTKPGETHKVHYRGTRERVEARARSAERIFTAHGWTTASRDYEPALLWRWKPLASLLAEVAEPQIDLIVVYEFQHLPDRL